jgi:hypothetical protein
MDATIFVETLAEHKINPPLKVKSYYSQLKEDRYVVISFDKYMGVSVCTRK